MAKVERELIVEGEVYTVECAVCADGSSPAVIFLDALERGEWKPDPDAETLPNDAQIRDYDVFLELCRQLAETGLLRRRTSVNDLDDGVWELKRARKRLSFFDTPGDGTFRPKLRILEISESDHPESDMWWLPDFDDFIRLGHAFPKMDSSAGELNISETIRVRKEDLHHDTTR